MSALAQPVHEGGAADAAARELYERYSNRIFRYCLHRLRSNEEAEDAAQTTFLYAYLGLRRGVRPEFEVAWIYKIAENVCLTRLRTHARRGQFETTGDAFLLQELVPAAEHERSETVEALPGVLAGMPSSQRQALLLREVQGLSYREIADRLETSVSAVETLLFRARRSCARELRRVTQPVQGAISAGSLFSGVKSLLSRYLAASGGAKTAAVAVAAATGGALVLTTPALEGAAGGRPSISIHSGSAAAVASDGVPASDRIAPGRAAVSKDGRAPGAPGAGRSDTAPVPSATPPAGSDRPGDAATDATPTDPTTKPVAGPPSTAPPLKAPVQTPPLSVDLPPPPTLPAPPSLPTVPPIAPVVPVPPLPSPPAVPPVPPVQTPPLPKLP